MLRKPSEGILSSRITRPQESVITFFTEDYELPVITFHIAMTEQYTLGFTLTQPFVTVEPVAIHCSLLGTCCYSCFIEGIDAAQFVCSRDRHTLDRANWLQTCITWCVMTLALLGVFLSLYPSSLYSKLEQGLWDLAHSACHVQLISIHYCCWLIFKLDVKSFLSKYKYKEGQPWKKYGNKEGMKTQQDYSAAENSW